MQADGALQQNGHGRFALSGDLTAETARSLFDRMPKFGGGEVNIDLESVREVDSAGLALLLHWSNLAVASSGRLNFTGAPTQLRQMAKITGLEELFGG